MLWLSALAMGDHGEASPASGGGARVWVNVCVNLPFILSLGFHHVAWGPAGSFGVFVPS